MGMTTKKISATGIKALTALNALGGEVNWYAGVKGLDSRAMGPLAAAGLIEYLTCEHGADCRTGWVEGAHPADSTGDTTWYIRTRITQSGRDALKA